MTDTRESDQRDKPHSSLLGITGPVPKWLPVSLLAVSSVALVVPIVMLRRYKTGLQASSSRDIQGHAPPRRRYGTVALPASPLLGSPAASPPRVHLRANPSTPASPPYPNQRVRSSIPLPPQSTKDAFNGPLYTFKAFTIATALVAAGAFASVFGVMSYMGVNDTSEFAARMRVWVISTLPILSERIHRPPEPKDHEGLVPLFGSSDAPSLPPLAPASSLSGSSSSRPSFDMAAAQARLAAAYDRGGFYAWGEAAIKELEAEAEAERARTRNNLAGSEIK